MFALTPWVRQLIFLNVVIHVATIAFPQLYSMLGFVPSLILTRPWTLLTYMFVHAPGWGHLLFNMIGLFFFGPRLEERLGARHFIGLYLTAGIVGALLSFTSPYVMVIGASGAVYGVLLGFAYFWPHERIFIWGVLPIEARWLVAIFTALSLFSGFGGARDGIAHFAHLGGFLGAWLYLKWKEHSAPNKKFKRKVDGVGAKMGDRRTMERFAKIDPDALHEVNLQEWQRISQKIETAGVASLTPRERTFIDRFSR